MSWQDDWEVESQLGRGGQGNTRLVRRKFDGLRAVLKTLRKEKKKDLQARSRMHRESVALATLKETAARVPEVIASNTDRYKDLEVELYFVMTHIEGPTLAEFIDSHGPMPLDQAIRVTQETAHTLNVGHLEKLLHRDLKPKNIIFTGTGDAESIDGIPFIVDYGLSFNSSTDTDLTRTDETIGNEFLLLPETNVRGEDQRDVRSDVTAVGAILYYCLTGHPPISLRDSNDLAPHRRSGMGISHVSDDNLVAAQLNLLFDRAFAPLSRRFNNCDELLAQLAKIHTSIEGADLIDLHAVGNQTADILFSGNRRTQIAKLRDTAAPIYERLKLTLRSVMGTYDFFSVIVKNASGPDLPEEYDALVGHVVVDLSCPAVDVSASRSYTIAARGLELVVFAIQRNAIRASDELESVEVVIIQRDIESEMLVVVSDLKAWIVKQMREITTQYANDDAPPKPIKKRGGF